MPRPPPEARTDPSIGLKLITRLAAGLISLTGSKLPWREQLVISVFRRPPDGLDLLSRLGAESWVVPDHCRLRAFVGAVVLASILLHGVTAAQRCGCSERHV